MCSADVKDLPSIEQFVKEGAALPTHDLHGFREKQCIYRFITYDERIYYILSMMLSLLDFGSV